MESPKSLIPSLRKDRHEEEWLALLVAEGTDAVVVAELVFLPLLPNFNICLVALVACRKVWDDALVACRKVEEDALAAAEKETLFLVGVVVVFWEEAVVTGAPFLMLLLVVVVTRRNGMDVDAVL